MSAALDLVTDKSDVSEYIVEAVCYEIKAYVRLHGNSLKNHPYEVQQENKLRLRSARTAYFSPPLPLSVNRRLK